jgi:hypothetical protein
MFFDIWPLKRGRALVQVQELAKRYEHNPENCGSLCWLLRHVLLAVALVAKVVLGKGCDQSEASLGPGAFWKNFGRPCLY